MGENTATADPSASVYEEPKDETPSKAGPGGDVKSAPELAPEPEPEPEPEAGGKTKEPRPYFVLEQDPADEELFRLVKNSKSEDGTFLVLKADHAKELAAEQIAAEQPEIEKVTLATVPERSWNPELYIQPKRPRFQKAA